MRPRTLEDLFEKIGYEVNHFILPWDHGPALKDAEFIFKKQMKRQRIYWIVILIIAVLIAYAIGKGM